jgi:hypothetical protein
MVALVVAGEANRGAAARLVVLVVTVGIIAALLAYFISNFVVRGPGSLAASPATIAQGNTPAQNAFIRSRSRGPTTPIPRGSATCRRRS